jgi:phospholipid/cholesterol/gamma-HCH transport system permease protein
MVLRIAAASPPVVPSGAATTPRPFGGAFVHAGSPSARVSPGRAFGRSALGAVAHIGRFALFAAAMMRGLSEPRIWWPRMLAEATRIGVGSLFIVILVSAFAGTVTALQTGYQYNAAMPYYFVGTIVVSTVILELGPVLTALMLAGRLGARYAAELATMRVTEQIDALDSLGRSPASHLVIPRIVAGFIMIPILTVFADLSGVLAGWLAVKTVLPISDADFVFGAQSFYRTFDAYYSIIKAFLFAGAITIVPCYMGFTARQGAAGVGRATTAAVVTSSVLILLLDALVARVLLNR